MNDMPDFTIEKEEKVKRKKRNVGKQFEDDFKDSIPDNVFFLRFHDKTANFSGEKNKNVRFQSKNLCDCEMFYQGKLYLLELKSVKEKSFSFNNIDHKIYIDKDTGEKTIEYIQIKKLIEKSKIEGVTAGFIINFRDVEKAVFIDVKEMLNIINTCGKKSFNLQDLEKYSYTDIKCRKLKVHYRYDLSALIAPF